MGFRVIAGTENVVCDAVNSLRQAGDAGQRRLQNAADPRVTLLHDDVQVVRHDSDRVQTCVRTV